MPIALTSFGRVVLTQLNELWMLVLLIPSDNFRYNEKLHDDHEARKAKAIKQGRAWVEPYLQPGQRVEDVVRYTGEDASVQNLPYTIALEKFVAESTVCRAVDFYHWYLRRILELALKKDRSLIRRWNSSLGLSPKKIAAIESAIDLEDAVRGLFRGSEEPFRRLVHEYLDVPDLDVVPFAIKVRNCIVHECGEDRSGGVTQAAMEAPELNISVVNGLVSVSVDGAFEIISRMISDISIMDQMLGRMLNLPTDDAPLASIRRCG